MNIYIEEEKNKNDYHEKAMTQKKNVFQIREKNM
jgi:hypothetical protein